MDSRYYNLTKVEIASSVVLGIGFFIRTVVVQNAFGSSCGKKEILDKLVGCNGGGRIPKTFLLDLVLVGHGI